MPNRILILLALSLGLFFDAGSVQAESVARWVTSSGELPGGPAADGQVGDLLLANDLITLVISAIDHPYGYANTGGNIIDAVETTQASDAFGQLYLYLDDDWPRQANYTALSIIDDGSAGNPARVRAQGVDSQNAAISITTDYILSEGAAEVTITTTVINNSGSSLVDFELGDATQWAGLEKFAPGYGFEVTGTTFETWLAGAVGSQAYGYFAAGDMMWGPNGNGWSDINVVSVDLGPGQQASFTRYFHVGTGGVASVASRAHEVAGTVTGILSGSVSRNDGGTPLPGATVDVFDTGNSLYTQMVMDGAGQGQVSLAPGSWLLRAQADGLDTAEGWYTVNASGQTGFAFLLEEDGSAGSYALGDTLTVIQRPLMNIPAMVPRDGSFVIQCQAHPATSGWAVTLQREGVEVHASVTSAVYDASTTWWELTAHLPDVTLLELYDLRVTAAGGLDDTARHAVQVIEAEPSDFYFLHLTDTHVPTHYYIDNPESLTDTTEIGDLRAVIEDIALINPAFVVHTGDLINEGELEDFQGRRYYSRSQQILGELSVPLYLIAGNHDIGGWSDTPPSDGTARRDWWRFYGWKTLADPPAGAPLHTQNYSFDFGGVHFMAMESYVNYDMWRPEIYGERSFTTPQLGWLADEISGAGGDQAKVLFHHYDFLNQLDPASLGLDMVLFGHNHSNTGSLTTPPYRLSTAKVCDGGRNYRLVHVSDGVLDPRPTVSAGSSGQNLRVSYLPSNHGVADSVVATITNTLPETFHQGRLVFDMPLPQGEATPRIQGGTLVQVDNSGETSRWYVEVEIAADATTTVIASFDGTTDVPGSAASRLALHPAFPNPFNPSTTLRYSLPQSGHVRLAILDLRGRQVALLVDETQDGGDHAVIWNGVDGSGQAVSSGVYMVQVHSAGITRTSKIVLSK